MAQTPDRRSPLTIGSRLLTDEVLLDRNGFGSGILFLEPPGWYGTFDPTSPSGPARHFPGSDHLGPSEGLHGPNLPNSLAGGNNMGERGETRGHVTKVTDVLRNEVIAWWGQYGEKLDETNSDLASAREKTKMFEENLGSSEVDPLVRASSLEGPSVPRGLPVGAGVQRPSAPPGALAGVPFVTKHLSECAGGLEQS